MQISKNQAMLSNQVTYSERDMVTLAEVSIRSIADLIARRYVEEHFEELVKDEVFMAAVKAEAAKATGNKVADHVVEMLRGE